MAAALALAQELLRLRKLEQARQTIEGAMLQLSAAKMRASTAYAQCLDMAAKIAEAEGRHIDSVTLLGEALEFEESLTRQNLDTIAARTRRLVTAHKNCGDPAAAVPILKKALAMSEAALGSNHMATADLHSELAAVWQASGQHEEALRHLALAMPVHDTASEGAPTTKLVRDLRLMGGSLRSTGDSGAAAEHFTRAIRLTERQLNADAHEVAAILLQLMHLEIEANRMAAAREHLMQAIAVLTRFQDTDLAMALELMADMQYNSGRWEEVEPCLEKARKIWEKAGNARRTELVNNLNRHASWLDHVGKSEKADVLRVKAAEAAAPQAAL
ncbi:MAG TPA: tetratricopeptide repeat protein [Bryobacteraceae bacterium]|nr:tetratricopeptide repeat protein [Bryobacteraceae bacterium]